MSLILLLKCSLGSWRLEDLSQKIQVPASVTRKKIAYWQAQGLIEETSTDQFTLIENIEQHARSDSGMYTNDCFTVSKLQPLYLVHLYFSRTS